MRILVAASTFPRWPGDTVPPFVFELSQRLALKGHEIHVLVPHAPDAVDEETMGHVRVHRFRYAPVRLESLAYGGGVLENLRRDPARWGLVGPFMAAELNAIVRLSRRFAIEAVHAHWLIPQGLVAASSRPFIRRPIVMTAHGADVFAMSRGVRRYLLRSAARRADVCTVNSAATHEMLERATGVSATVIPMGVDLSTFGESSKQGGGGSRRAAGQEVLFVGRLAEKKGVRFLVEAMPAIRVAFSGAHLRIVGDGPERESLEALTRQLGLADVIEFLGALPQRDLVAVYRSADVFVAPSVVAASGDTEGLGVVILEAAASGTPVVASRVGGITDVIDGETTGLLVEPENPGAIAAAVTRLLADETLAASLSDGARELVSRRYSWDVVADQFDSIFKSLVGPPHGPRVRAA